MQRRTFVRTGVAAGLLGMGVEPTLRDGAWAMPRARRAEGPIRLSSNENPLGLAPAARQAVIDNIPNANRYPFAVVSPLKKALAAKHGVAEESLVLGAGSTEVLQMAVQVMGQGNATFISADPTYEDVPSYAKPWDLRVEKVPLRADHSHDIGRMREVANRVDGQVLVYICNPNNPTGSLTRCSEIDEWIGSASERTNFLVDEAYFEYAEKEPGYWTSLKWIADRPNVMVVRTFSKIFGMAGMRLGYGMAHPETAAKLSGLAGKNNANYLACAAGLASLEDDGLVARSIESNQQAGGVLHGVLEDLDIAYLPSHTNFLMHRIKGELATYRERMLEAGFAVGRPFPPMLTYNRVSLGLPEEMEHFAAVLRTFRERGWV